MKRSLEFIALFLLITVLALPSFAAKVTFIVKPSGMPDNGPVCIVGSHALVGSWNPSAVPFTAQPDGSWMRTIEFDAGSAIEYKITRGSWEKEALAPDLSVPVNSVLHIDADTTIVIVVPKWKDEVEGARPQIRGQVTGTVITHKQMTGEGILPRDVQVWLPPSYDKEPNRRYPVLYMHDGQQVFDPATSTHGIDWGIDELVTKLSGDGTIKEIIVVGVNNSAQRFPDYSDGPTGRAYQRFLAYTLKPFIDSTYRTLPSRENTSVMGASMGGIASFLMVWHHPDLFSMAGCLSPAFFLDWDELRGSDWPRADMPVKIYIDNGGIGLEKRLQHGCDLMIETLQPRGFTLGKNLVWFNDTQAEHNEAAWANRSWMPLQYFYGNAEQKWIAALPAPPKPILAARDLEWRGRVTMDTIVLLGFARQMTDNSSAEDYAALWNRLADELKQAGIASHSYVASSTELPMSENIDFFCGIPVNSIPSQLPTGLATRVIPPTAYVDYPHSVKMHERRDIYIYFDEWYFPRNRLRLGATPVLEWYSELPSVDKPNATRMLVPVEKR